MEAAMDSGRELVSTAFIIPYPPGFPILVPGQVISRRSSSISCARSTSRKFMATGQTTLTACLHRHKRWPTPALARSSRQTQKSILCPNAAS